VYSGLPTGYMPMPEEWRVLEDYWKDGTMDSMNVYRWLAGAPRNCRRYCGLSWPLNVDSLRDPQRGLMPGLRFLWLQYSD
jgi:hypothetical protein